MMALYEGLVEYHPKTMEPIRDCESWEIEATETKSFPSA